MGSVSIIGNFLDSFPYIEPYWALMSFILTPIVIISVIIYITSVPLEVSGFRRKFLIRCIYIIDKFSVFISIGSFFLSLVLCVNQTAYIYRKISFTTSNINYYLKVNIPAFDNIQIINSVQAATSFNYYLSSISPNVQYETPSNSGIHGRHLDVGSNYLLSLIYHKGNWDNILSIPDLQKICETERVII